MDKLKIRGKLIEMLKEKLSIIIDENLFNEHFMSEKIKMPPRVLVYMFFCIQEEFAIQIGKRYINNNSFTSINNVVDIIYEINNRKESKVTI